MRNAIGLLIAIVCLILIGLFWRLLLRVVLVLSAIVLALIAAAYVTIGCGMRPIRRYDRRLWEADNQARRAQLRRGLV